METTLYKRLGVIFVQLVLLVLLLQISTVSTYAQSSKYYKRHMYLGMVGGFGARSFDIKSDIPQINNLKTSKAGGSLGVIYGTSAIKFPLVVGLYYQSIQETRTIDLFSVQGGVNISVLHLIGLHKSPFDIYTLAAVDFQKYTFMGTYIEFQEGQKKRMVMGEPLLGNVSMINADLGVGVEYRLRDDFNFVHVFMEAKKTYELNTSSSASFDQTTVNNSLAFNVGLRIGTAK